MQSIRCSLAPMLFWLLVLTTPIEQCIGQEPAGKVNALKKSVDGLVLFTATIPQESRAGEPVSLSLQLKNLGKELLVFDDNVLDTFVLIVKTKDGTVIPVTRYLDDILARRKGNRGRFVQIELEPSKEAGVALPLNRFFDLSRDGEYAVSMEARYAVKRTDGKIAIENLPFTIRWVPSLSRITRVE
jgi:hypothetical protein